MMDTTTLSIPASETVQAEGSSEWSPDELRDRVAQEQELRSIIVDYYRSNMGVFAQRPEEVHSRFYTAKSRTET
jgi:hypothetical protein